MRAAALAGLMIALLLLVPIVHAEGELFVSVSSDKTSITRGEAVTLTATVSYQQGPFTQSRVMFFRVMPEGTRVPVSSWLDAPSGTASVTIATGDLPAGWNQFVAMADYTYTERESFTSQAGMSGYGTTSILVSEATTDTARYLQVSVMPDHYSVFRGTPVQLTATVTLNSVPRAGAVVTFSRAGSGGAIASGQTNAEGTVTVTVPTDTLDYGPVTFRATAEYDSGVQSLASHFVYTGSGETVVHINPPVTTVPPRECTIGTVPCPWILVIIVIIIALWLIRPRGETGPSREQPKDEQPRKKPDRILPKELTIHARGGIEMKGDTEAVTGLELAVEGGIDYLEKDGGEER